MDPTPATDWASTLEAFVAYERAVGGLAPATLRKRRLYLGTYARWWERHGPGRPLAQATTADLAAFLVAETERGIKASTRKAQVAALRRFYSWMVLTERATHDPTVQLRAPRAVPVEIEVYPPAAIAAILAHTASLRDVLGRQRHAIVSTLRYTGMRSGELRTLRLDRLDLDAGQASVIGKGSRPRPVVLPPPLRPILRRFLDEVRPALPDSPLLLANPHPRVTTPMRGLGPEALYYQVELAGLGSGVPGRHFPHRWRHTFATELVRAGVDIHLVQRLLGHRSIASTVGYTHLAVDDLQTAVERLW